MKIRPVGAPLLLVDRQTVITKRKSSFWLLMQKTPKIVKTKNCRNHQMRCEVSQAGVNKG